MSIAIVVIHYGQKSTSQECLILLKKKIGKNQLILINNSPDNMSDLAQIIPGTQVVNNNKNIGFARAVNQGIELALKNRSIQAVLLMNNDLSFSFGSPEQLMQTFVSKPMAGIASPVLYHGGKWYDWGASLSRWTGIIKHLNFKEKPKTILSVESIAGAAMLIKRDAIERIGLFDERFFLYYEDADYCLRARKAGFTVHINPQIVAEHQVSASSSLIGRTYASWVSHMKFVIKHMGKEIFVTALPFDLVYYPLLIIWSMVRTII